MREGAGLMNARIIIQFRSATDLLLWGMGTKKWLDSLKSRTLTTSMGHNGPSQQQTCFVYFFYCLIYLTFTYFEYSHKVNFFLSRNWNLLMKKKNFHVDLSSLFVLLLFWKKFMWWLWFYPKNNRVYSWARRRKAPQGRTRIGLGLAAGIRRPAWPLECLRRFPRRGLKVLLFRWRPETICWACCHRKPPLA